MQNEPESTHTQRTEQFRNRIRELCRHKGWDLGELAQRAGLSRTTLYHLEKGRTRRPHGSTLRKIAAALEVRPEQLWEEGDEIGRRPRPAFPAPTPEEADTQRDFDRGTNPMVADVADEWPELFREWTESEWDELYSSVGTGGPLTREGVVEAAATINRKRRTVQQLHVLLETHLSEVAAGLIETLYGLVRPAGNPDSTSGPAGER